jgi:50S ribosomal protein L16 3-hydroxylase
MATLADWLQPMDVARFVSLHLGHEPLARASTAASCAEICDWRMLNDVLGAEPSDVLVVAHGKCVERAVPRSLADLRTLFNHGIGIAIRAPETVNTRLRELAAEFAAELPGEQRLILFATPAQTHGFGWHYDAEDVFVVQTAGDKEYYLRRNTVSPSPEPGFQSDFAHFSQETSPLLACRLLPGDCLYVPKGFWHIAVSHTDSMSLSIGVFPRV